MSIFITVVLTIAKILNYPNYLYMDKQISYDIVYLYRYFTDIYQYI